MELFATNSLTTWLLEKFSADRLQQVLIGVNDSRPTAA